MRLFIIDIKLIHYILFLDIEEYTENIRKNIRKTSPFRAQSQVTPEDEKRRLIDLFREINLNNKLFPDVVIIHKFDFLKILKLKIKNISYFILTTHMKYF